tara:strand:+ start:752 stop:985 length:234 start_codon:yes stop_codon:yes gene_type:complete
MSKIEELVIEKIRGRAEIGESKYGTTMERSDLDVEAWLIHLQEELMDGVVYVEKLLSEIRDFKTLISKVEEVVNDAS